jgi:hypothetical protein
VASLYKAAVSDPPSLAEPAPAGRAPPRAAERALRFACLGTFGYGRDQGIYAMVARAVLAGGMPYRDAWDFKPPGIFLIYAASRAVLGSGQVGIRVVEAAGLVAMIAAMVRLTEEWWGSRRVGLLAGAVAALVHVQLDFWHTAQPESFGGMITIFALAALGPSMSGDAELRAETRAMSRRLLLSGALFGVAGLLKPPLAGGGAVVAAALGLRVLAERRSWSARGIAAALRPAALILIGGASPFVVCLLWFALKGALGSLYDVLFVFTPHYTLLSWVDRTATGLLYEGFTDWLTEYSSVATVGVCLGVAFPRLPRERFGVRVIGAIIAVHVVGVVMQAKFFPYHWGATWPLTALLAGLGFHRIWERLAPLGIPGVAAFFAIVLGSSIFRTATKDVEENFLRRSTERLSIFTHRPRSQAALDRLASVADVNAAANREVAAFLHERVPEGRKVFVWGFEPVIYDLADRAPATRYIYDVPQRVAWAKDKERAILMRDLAAGRPAAIVVERRDVFPVVTGDAIDSADTLAGFPALADLLAGGYTLEATIEDFDVYLERR